VTAKDGSELLRRRFGEYWIPEKAFMIALERIHHKPQKRKEPSLNVALAERESTCAEKFFEDR
jgi:hypothetical protein